MVNRNAYDVKRAITGSIPAEAQVRYFDVYHGVELTPAERAPSRCSSFDMEANGFGGVLAAFGAGGA